MAGACKKTQGAALGQAAPKARPGGRNGRKSRPPGPFYTRQPGPAALRLLILRRRVGSLHMARLREVIIYKAIYSAYSASIVLMFLPAIASWNALLISSSL